MDKIRVSGITTSMNVSKIVLDGVEDRPGTGAKVFSLLGDEGINVELISQSGSGRGLASISFVVVEGEAPRVLDVVKQSDIRPRSIMQDARAAVITVYSGNLRTMPGVASSLFKALSGVGVNIDIISTSLNSVSVVIARDRCSAALTALNGVFDAQGVSTDPVHEPPVR